MRISVIIPVYNAARYVGAAVNSALAQPETAEVLLIDDGSADASLGECRRLAKADARVRVLQHPDGQNRGAAASRNLGLAQAKEQFIAFLDADDFYLANRFRPACRAWQQDPSIDGVYDAVGVRFESDEAEAWWQRNRADQDMTTVRQQVPPERLFEVLLGGESGYFCTDGIVLRRSLVDRVGRFDGTLRMAEDTLLWLKCAAAGRLVGGSLDQPVAMRRVHGQNSIIRNQDAHAGWGEVMYARLWEWMRSAEVSRQAKGCAGALVLEQRMASLRGRRGLAWRLGALRLAMEMLREAGAASAGTPLRDSLLRLVRSAVRLPRRRSASPVIVSSEAAR